MARTLPAIFGALERTAPAVAGWWADRLFFTPPRPSLSPRLRSIVAEGNPFEIAFGTRTLPAWRWGRGPTVLLVHGWGSRAGHLGTFVAPLVAAGFSPVAFDAPAHGAATGRRTNVPEIARAMATVAKEAGPVHGVVAHSAGAAATAVALQNGLPAARVVFLAPAGNPEGFTRTFAGRIGLGPRSIRAMRARAERRIGVSFAELDIRVLALAQRAPLLVVHDREDEEIGWADGAAVAAAWPGAEMVVTRGLGHHRLLKDAGVVARAVSFLRGRDGRACGHDRGCSWDGREELCPSCALDRDLFDREGRRAQASAERPAAAYFL